MIVFTSTLDSSRPFHRHPALSAPSTASNRSAAGFSGFVQPPTADSIDVPKTRPAYLSAMRLGKFNDYGDHIGQCTPLRPVGPRPTDLPCGRINHPPNDAATRTETRNPKSE